MTHRFLLGERRRRLQKQALELFDIDECEREHTVLESDERQRLNVKVFARSIF